MMSLILANYPWTVVISFLLLALAQGSWEEPVDWLASLILSIIPGMNIVFALLAIAFYISVEHRR